MQLRLLRVAALVRFRSRLVAFALDESNAIDHSLKTERLRYTVGSEAVLGGPMARSIRLLLKGLPPQALIFIFYLWGQTLLILQHLWGQTLLFLFYIWGQTLLFSWSICGQTLPIPFFYFYFLFQYFPSKL